MLQTLLPQPSLSKAVACPPAPRGGDFRRRDTLFAGNAARADVLCPRRESHASLGAATALSRRRVLHPDPRCRRRLRPKRGGAHAPRGEAVGALPPSSSNVQRLVFCVTLKPPLRDLCFREGKNGACHEGGAAARERGGPDSGRAGGRAPLCLPGMPLARRDPSSRPPEPRDPRGAASDPPRTRELRARDR